MSAKILSSLSDDNTQQTGCISLCKFFRWTTFPADERGRNHHKKRLLTPGKVSTESSYSSHSEPKDNQKPSMQSPRPSPAAHAKVHESLVIPRSSYDECESRVIVKIEESPRLSLDSRIGESKVSLHLKMENENHPIKQHQSSIIAKLMGLEAFPDTVSKPESRATTAKAIESAASRNRDDSLNKPTRHLKVTVEPSSWRQRGCCQGSPKMAARTRKPQENVPHLTSSSIYGFGILESMEKSNQGLEKQTEDNGELGERQRLENQCLNQKPDFPIRQHRRTCFQKPLIFPTEITNSNLNGEVIVSATVDPQANNTIQNLKHQRENNPVYRRKEKNFSQRNNIKKSSEHLSSINKKGIRTLRVPELRMENCVKSGSLSPRLHSNPLKVQGKSPRTSPSCSCKTSQKSTGSKRGQPISAHLQSNDDDRLSEHSTESRYSSNQGDTDSLKSESNNSEVSMTETEVTSFLPNSIITNSRKQNCMRSTAESLPSVEAGTNIMEQRSPVSVLDNTFYNEDSPSPVEKISTAFQEDERTSRQGEQNIGKSVYFKANTNGSENPRVNRDQRYINETILLSKHLKGTIINRTSDRVLCSWLLNDSKVSKDLEEMEDDIKSGKWMFTEKKDKKILNQQGKTVLDMANEILIRKITMGGLLTSRRKITSLQAIIKEVSLEIEHRCHMPYLNLDDEDDGMIKLLTADLKHQSEDWRDSGGEVPYLVLDIERQIFKYLINEVVFVGNY